MTSTVEQTSWVITEPGVVDGMPDEVYHADPVPGGSLSSTGARKLLPPSSPSKFRYERDHGRPPKREFDFGHVAHKLVLGKGGDVEMIDAENYRTAKAREAQAAAYARGAIPILPHEMAKAEAMAKAVREHPVAGQLFTDGRAELSLFARDPQTGVMMRARIDWLRNSPSPEGRLILADYKTTTDATPDAIAKAVRTYGYHQQDAWYSEVARLLRLAEQAGAEELAFVFVFQEKTPPHEIQIVELVKTATFWGEVLNRHALNLYARCVETGRWPGYPPEVMPLALPAWAEREYEAAQSRGDYDLEGMFK